MVLECIFRNNTIRLRTLQNIVSGLSLLQHIYYDFRKSLELPLKQQKKHEFVFVLYFSAKIITVQNFCYNGFHINFLLLFNFLLYSKIVVLDISNVSANKYFIY